VATRDFMEEITHILKVRKETSKIVSY
jgi:hypothetical protein